MTYDVCIEFIETSIFTKQVEKLMDDSSYMALQQILFTQPKIGSVIPGCGGLRKVRWKGSGRGKAGGLRIIYYYVQTHQICLFLYAYTKSEHENLTHEQLSILAKLVQEEFT